MKWLKKHFVLILQILKMRYNTIVLLPLIAILLFLAMRKISNKQKFR